jgi:hypothetical protein
MNAKQAFDQVYEGPCNPMTDEILGYKTIVLSENDRRYCEISRGRSIFGLGGPNEYMYAVTVIDFVDDTLYRMKDLSKHTGSTLKSAKQHINTIDNVSEWAEPTAQNV